jgi:hypothetical protein
MNFDTYARLCWLAGFFQGITHPGVSNGDGSEQAEEFADIMMRQVKK